MKKRMLVTTIALVLVIAVALTTSSLAWFSSSSTVATKDVEFTAATATGTNLVLSNYGETDLDKYGNEVTLPTGSEYKPVQGKVTFAGANPFTFPGSNNQLTFNTNPFYGSSAVVQTSGYAVEKQKVTFEGNGKYLAGGFNFTNVNRYEISGGVKVDATITLATEDDTTKTVDAENKVKKGYIAYEGGWKDADDVITDPAKAVFYYAKDVALLASIRIAVCGATDVIQTDGEDVSFAATYDDAKAEVYGWGDKGFILGSSGSYELTEGGNQNKYVPGGDEDLLSSNPEDEKSFVYNPDASGTYGKNTGITGITYDAKEGVFTFSYTIAEKISADNAGSIAFVIWMDGWDESALPGVSDGKFMMGFKLTK